MRQAILDAVARGIVQNVFTGDALLTGAVQVDDDTVGTPFEQGNNQQHVWSPLRRLRLGNLNLF